MEYLLLNEIFRLLFNQYGMQPESFVSLFNQSELMAAFNFKINGKKFTHVSKSFSKLLGFKCALLSANDKRFNDMFHPHDLKLFHDYFKIVPELNNYSHDTDINYHVKRMKCRIRHLKGYWKYLIFISFNYKNSMDNGFHKIGLIAEDRSSPYYILLSNLNLHLIIDNGSQKKSSGIKIIDIYNNNKISVTKRENEILELVGRGFIAKEIADQLNISSTTVITHRKNLISKFKVKNTAELVGKASRLLLI